MMSGQRKQVQCIRICIELYALRSGSCYIEAALATGWVAFGVAEHLFLRACPDPRAVIMTTPPLQQGGPGNKMGSPGFGGGFLLELLAGAVDGTSHVDWQTVSIV